MGTRTSFRPVFVKIIRRGRPDAYFVGASVPDVMDDVEANFGWPNCTHQVVTEQELRQLGVTFISRGKQHIQSGGQSSFMLIAPRIKGLL